MRNTCRFLLLLAFVCCADAMAFGNSKYWVATHQWTSNGNFQTEPFRIYGKKWRIRAQFNRKAQPVVTCYDAETDQFTSFFQHTYRGNQKRYTRSITMKNESQADRFISVQCKDSSWTIILEQYIDHTDEWLSRKDHARRLAAVQSLGTWSGTGNQTIVFDTAEALWFLQAVPQLKGNFQVTVRDREDKVIFSSAINGPEEHRSCFFYAPGRYTIDVKATEIPWVIYASQTQNKTLEKP